MYGLAAHAGDWHQTQTDWQAQRLNTPLIAFEASKHQGSLGKNFSVMKASSSRTRVLALKKAEQSNEVIVRLVELDGKPAENVRIAFAAPIVAAREVNGAEEPVGPATITKGELVTSFTPFQPRSFAVKLAAGRAKVAPPRWQPVELSYDRSVATVDQTKSVGGFDAAGRALAAEMLAGEIAYDGIEFKLAPAQPGGFDAVVPRGQTIPLPAGKFTRLCVLAAADGDQKATFRIGDKPVDLTIQDWGGFIGQWDTRLWNTRQEPVSPSPGAPTEAPRMRTVMEYAGLTPGFIKREPVAWFASHRHTAEGANEPYAYSYLYAYAIDMPANVRTVTLPANDKVRVLAVTVAAGSGEARPAQPLYDTLER